MAAERLAIKNMGVLIFSIAREQLKACNQLLEFIKSFGAN